MESHAHQQLATFAAELARQHEVREKAAYQSEWTAAQRERVSEVDERLRGSMGRANVIREDLRGMLDAARRLAAIYGTISGAASC